MSPSHFPWFVISNNEKENIAPTMYMSGKKYSKINWKQDKTVTVKKILRLVYSYAVVWNSILYLKINITYTSNASKIKYNLVRILSKIIGLPV